MLEPTKNYKHLTSETVFLFCFVFVFVFFFIFIFLFLFLCVRKRQREKDRKREREKDRKREREKEKREQESMFVLSCFFFFFFFFFFLNGSSWAVLILFISISKLLRTSLICLSIVMCVTLIRVPAVVMRPLVELSIRFQLKGDLCLPWRHQPPRLLNGLEGSFRD